MSLENLVLLDEGIVLCTTMLILECCVCSRSVLIMLTFFALLTSFF